jgi:cytochrome c oxidase subunit III
MEPGAHTATMAAGWGGGVSPFGATWQKTMMWIFIVTDALLFSGLLCGYAFLRQSSLTPWPDRTQVFQIWFIALMTFILITSSMTMGTAVTAARLGDMKKALMMLVFTILGGTAFLGCQAYEWTHLIHEGARLTGPIAGSELIEKGVNAQFTQAFFLLTGFHGSHVFSGLVILIITAIRTSMGKTPAQGVEMAGLYWHFVDLVWVFIFTLFYLL